MKTSSRKHSNPHEIRDFHSNLYKDYISYFVIFKAHQRTDTKFEKSTQKVTACRKHSNPQPTAQSDPDVADAKTQNLTEGNENETESEAEAGTERARATAMGMGMGMGMGMARGARMCHGGGVP